MPKAAKASSTPRRTAPQSKRTLLPLSKAKMPVTREHDVGGLPKFTVWLSTATALRRLCRIELLSL